MPGASSSSIPLVTAAAALPSNPHLRLGKNPGVPNWRHERQWQIADAVTLVAPDFFGEHLLKSGIDINVVRSRFEQLNDRDGTFRFETDLPFDPLVARTYPSRYTRTSGEPFAEIDDTVVAVFVQDQWRPGNG